MAAPIIFPGVGQQVALTRYCRATQRNSEADLTVRYLWAEAARSTYSLLEIIEVLKIESGKPSFSKHPTSTLQVKSQG